MRQTRWVTIWICVIQFIYFVYVDRGCPGFILRWTCGQPRGFLYSFGEFPLRGNRLVRDGRFLGLRVAEEGVFHTFHEGACLFVCLFAEFFAQFSE